MKTTKEERQETIDFAKNNGIYIVPLEGKSPKIAGENWNIIGKTEEKQKEWEGWLLTYPNVNIGFMCGKCRNGKYLLVADVDSEILFKKVFSRFMGMTTIVRTGSGKYHFYFFVDNPMYAKGFRIHEGDVQIDFQGEGTQVVAPSSIHPQTYRKYVFECKMPPMVWDGDIKFEIKQLIKENFEFGLTEEIDIERILNGVEKGNRDNAAIILGTWYRIQGKAPEETKKLLLEWNKRNAPPWGEDPEDIGTAEYWVEQKVKSAWRPPEPYKFKFNSEAQLWANISEPVSFEEWRKVITDNFPHLWPYAEACASTITVLLIKDAQPLALVLQGVPGSGKTTTLDFFRGFPLSHATDKFTPKAFVSHVAQKSEKELKKIDLLPRIKDKVLITPDLSTLFGAKSEELKEIFSLLTRVLDGRGLTIDSGVYGTRGYEGDYMFTWIGATTPIPHGVWDLFGNLGARMFFMHVTKSHKTTADYVKGVKDKAYRKKVENCNKATLRFLKGIWRKEKIEWNSAVDPNSVIEKIVQLANLVCRLRGKINVVVKEEYTGEKTYYTQPIIEEPERCIQALYALARGHAIIKGRTQITVDDLPIVIDVALSSAPWDRIIAFAYLLNKEKVATKELMEDLKCSRTKAIRTMKTLELLELVDLEEENIPTVGGEQTGYVMRLKKEFEWFTTEEFKKLWRIKLRDIIKPAEELTQQESIETKKEAQVLTPFIKMYACRARQLRRSNTKQEG
jgi:predicted transcriptional regulator